MTTLSKAVVLAAGAGSRMRAEDSGPQLSEKQSAAARAGAKAMMPLGARPFLDYVLHGLADAGIEEVCLVVPPDHRPIADHYVAVRPQRLSIEFAVQREPLGTAHAVLAAESFAGSDPFLLINGDNHYSVEALRSLCEAEGPALAAFAAEELLEPNLPGGLRNQRLMAYSEVGIDGECWLASITEKPPRPPRWVSMNCWRFGPTIFEACRAVGPSSRGELELPSAVLYSIEHLGQAYRALPAPGPVLDLSSRADVLRVEATLANIEVLL